MIIRYKKRDGRTAEFVLEGNNITLGRSPDADIIVLDERASRLHAGIRLYEGEYYIKDLQSRNGTWLNGERVENKEKIASGDKIRLGKFVCTVVANTASADIVSRDIEHEMEEGKGFGTLMREIVDEVDDVEVVENEFTPVEADQKALTMPISLGDAAADAMSDAAESAEIGISAAVEPVVDQKNLTIPIDVEEPEDMPEDSKPKPPPRPKLPAKPSMPKLKPKLSLGGASGNTDSKPKPPPPPKLKPPKPPGGRPATIKLKGKSTKKPSIKLRPPKKKD